MVCQKCGKELTGNEKFCSNCGTPVAAEQSEVIVPETEEKVSGNDQVVAENAEVLEAEEKEQAEVTPAEVTEKADNEAVNEAANETVTGTVAPAPQAPVETTSAASATSHSAPAAAVPAAPQVQEQYRMPEKETAPSKKSPYAVLTPGQWAWTMILLSIPVVNVIVWLVWLFGGSKYKTRTNMVRGQLLLWLICVLVTLAAYLILIFAAPGVFQTIRDFIVQHMPQIQ